MKRAFNNKIYLISLSLAICAGLSLAVYSCKEGPHQAEKIQNDQIEYIGLPLDSLKKMVRDIVDKVKNDPNGRYELRKQFYKKYGDGEFSEYGYGDSELAFLKWEKRGLLNPPDTQPAGSPWWRSVNLEFIYWSELAGLIYSSDLSWGDDSNIPVATLLWLDYLKNPGPKTWYRAHNHSIIAAYLKYPGLAQKEILAEQVFINKVLYRLLFAQAMVEAEQFAFGELGELLADPEGFAVDFIVNDLFFYPSTYPLSKKEQAIILGQSHSIGELEVKFLDNDLILPHLEELYHTAAKINQIPGLLKFIKDGKPVYPNLEQYL